MLNVAIVGAGDGGTAILRTLLTVPDINLYGICDKNTNTPGIKLARMNNIEIYKDYMGLLDYNKEKLIIEVTGNDNIKEELNENADQDTTIIDSNVALLIYKIVNTRESIISRIEKESAELGELANQISSSIQETSAVSLENSGQFNITINDLVTAANKNKTYINETSEIIKFINKVSKQTKMLGLNAAIEANRAGYQGNGFQIVADEIRKLAEETGNSVKQITNFIEELNNSTEQTISHIDDMKEHTEKFNKIQEDISDNLKNVARQINSLANNLENISEE